MATPTPTATAAAATRRAENKLVQLRVAPRDGGPSARDWVPRLRVGDRTRSGEITVVWEGAVGMRRAVFDEVWGWPDAFRFVHISCKGGCGWLLCQSGPRIVFVSHPRDLSCPLHDRSRV